MFIGPEGAFIATEQWQRLQQESKQRQQQLLQSDVLPDATEEVHSMMTEAGFVFGDPAEDMPDAHHVQLPPGWTRQQDQECHWLIDLVDSAGHCRFVVSCGFTTDSVVLAIAPALRLYPSVNSYFGGGATSYVWDGDRHETRYQFFVDSPDRAEAESAALNKAREWLNTEYPNWRNPNAYRDEH